MKFTTRELTTLAVFGVLWGIVEMSLGTRQFGAQLLGALVIASVIFGVAYAFFSIQNRLTSGGIRPMADDEEAGLDLVEMGVPAYDTPLTTPVR